MNSYRFGTSQKPTDEMLAQIMHEAAEDAKKRYEEASKSTLMSCDKVLKSNS